MSRSETRSPLTELRAERLVAGGVCLARETSGRVVLVDGALPGERVRVVLTEQKKTLAKGDVTEVLEASPLRVPAPCPALHAGCGGCDLQHAAHDLQRSAKAGVVADALARIGRLRDVPIDDGEHLEPWSHRTVLRCGVDDEGRAGLRRRRSNEVLALDACPVAHPLIDEVLAGSRFPGADEVTIRVGARTGERMVVVTPTATDDVRVPTGVLVAGADEPGDVAVHEVVDRRRFRISAGSFFQSRPDGAEALVRAVRRALGPVEPRAARVADLYGGVGLFSVALDVRDGVLVERSPSSAADARRNLAGRDVEVVADRVERWSAHGGTGAGGSDAAGFDAVVADPARAGLGAEGVSAVARTGAVRVALVSCDPASLARDARGLVDAGYRIQGVELVDLFPQTHHVEAVTSFDREGS